MLKWFTMRDRPTAQPVSVPSHLRRSDDSRDLAEEVEKILRAKRWDKQGDEPFKGFGSFPGRF